MNRTFASAGRRIIKELLDQCTEGQQNVFIRMYSGNVIYSSIAEVVDNMPDEKIDHAITQCENSVARNKMIAAPEGQTNV
jgi:precorrin-4 methylase